MKMRHMKKRNRAGGRPLRFAALVLCLTAAASCFSSHLLARHKVTVFSGNDAVVALWNADTEISDNSVKVSANDAYAAENGYYTFTVIPGGSAVASKYSLKVTLKDQNGLTVWPAGMTAKLTDAEGNNAVENTTGVFQDIGDFTPGETEGISYRLYLKATEDVTGGMYSVEITVTVEQVE